MKVFFPYTNPIVFDDAEYHSYKDARSYEYIQSFTQYFGIDDRLCFQLKFIEKDSGLYNFKIYFIINGITTFYRQIGISNQNSVVPFGMIDTNSKQFFAIQKLKATQNYQGLFVFSMKFSDITTGYNLPYYDDDTFYEAGDIVSYQSSQSAESYNYIAIAEMNFKGEVPTNTAYWTPVAQADMIAANDCIQVKLEIENVAEAETDTFYSNVIKIKEQGKLLAYNQTSFVNETVFDTSFGHLIYDYNLRLPSCFIASNKVNKEVFQGYNGKTSLISAMPFPIDTLIIKNIPDWLTRNLHYIFHLDEKRIDGIAYELSTDGELSVESIPQFSNKFLTVDLIRKDDEYYEIFEALENEGGYLTWTNSLRTAGYIDIITNKQWILTGSATYVFTFDQMSGNGTTRVYFTGYENTDSSEYTTVLTIKNKITLATIATIELTQPAYVASGIGTWAIGSTFKIS